ncbi:unnamed protein product [Phyllotreta striolata]|uniref:Lysosomal Pro-X carboxypeptidase n=1 Tax=Phyllotreta striolata TaxID=444603 RepID=A0A9N9TJX1_PHYSR|nr:unnamed protein product [Phyllotreta striolata]
MFIHTNSIMGQSLFHLSALFFAVYFNVADSQQRYSLETRYTDMPVTHYEWQKQMETFKLRYLVNNKYHVRGGPIFVYLGGRGDINVYSQNTGFLFEIAAKFGALIAFIEHRYYGESLPFGNESLVIDNLRYLTTTEVLADFVQTIDVVKREALENLVSFDRHPVIAFGGGYSGSLAAWLRMKYPFLVLGAIASSAPMIYSSSVTNCECFNDVVTRTFEKYGQEQCVKTVKLGWEIIVNLSRSKLGLDFISSTWKLCKRMSSAEDVEKLLNWLNNIYVKLALNNYHYPSDFFMPLPAYPLKVFCDKLTSSFFNDTKGLVEYFGQALQVYTNYSGKSVCNSLEEPTDYLLKYQECTELVMPKCSIDTDMFINKPWVYENFALECHAKYGISGVKADWITLAYGGRNMKYASNIVFSHGEMDPYTCYGMRNNASSTVWTFDIADGSHHVDLRNPDVSDNNYILTARRHHVQAINTWLKLN